MIGEVKKVRLLILEDEHLIAKDIAEGLIECGYEIAGIAPSSAEAKKLLMQDPDIDLILIDIILRGDETGLTFAKLLDRKYPHIPYIFLTSHADAAMVNQVKTTTPYAYILKPFNKRQVAVSIEMALENFSNRKPIQDILASNNYKPEPKQVLKINDSLFLKKDNHFERVLLKEILFLEAESNYTTIHTQCGRFVYSMVLKKIEGLLPSDFFLRVHRSFVVNMEAVTGFEGNLLFVEQHKIPVSKSHHHSVFKSFRRI
ncbi:LytR/AlgR family response regulator transcription factor [Flagellimonas sp.]|uniref:LytR/AlgR family response regulator transcription factor n=1 Tax=Flagellimonas sp. TaxID=2058762 RepID=UPI003B5A56B9